MKYALQITLSEQEPTAYQRFGLVSACTQHSIKRVLWVTKPHNGLDGVIDTHTDKQFMRKQFMGSFFWGGCPCHTSQSNQCKVQCCSSIMSVLLQRGKGKNVIALFLVQV